jgi:hypothetical protein
VETVSSILEAIPPAWIVVALIGAGWAGISCVVFPPRFDRFPGILGAALAGAAAGQLSGATLIHGTPMVGDVQVVGVSLGAVAALGIVRFFRP